MTVMFLFPRKRDHSLNIILKAILLATRINLWRDFIYRPLSLFRFGYEVSEIQSLPKNNSNEYIRWYLLVQTWLTKFAIYYSIHTAWNRSTGLGVQNFADIGQSLYSAWCSGVHQPHSWGAINSGEYYPLSHKDYALDYHDWENREAFQGFLKIPSKVRFAEVPITVLLRALPEEIPDIKTFLPSTLEELCL